MPDSGKASRSGTRRYRRIVRRYGKAKPSGSKVTSGAELLPGIDGRSTTARRYRDLVVHLITDQGGADNISEVRAALIRRFAAAACLAEEIEARVCRNEQIDLDDHAQLVSSLVRLANHLGLERIPRTIGSYAAEILDGSLTTPPSSDASLRSRMSAEDADATP